MKRRLRLFFLPEEDPACIRVGIDLGLAGIHSALITANGVPLRRSGDALFCLGLAPAMQLGWELVLEAAVAPQLLGNAAAIQDFFTRWYPDFSRVRVFADPDGSVSERAGTTGLFFSGGVDSFYSAITERERLDTLVTILGADIDAGYRAGIERLRDAAEAVGHAWGLEVIEIRTDLRRVFDGLVGWEEFHGSALAAIRHLLGGKIGTQLIASTAGATSWDRGWGSHPALDPLLGTPAAPIVHHGLVGRADKILRIAAEPLALRHLRVCYLTADGTNCGSCAKCSFVIETLRLFGALHRAETFPETNGRIVCTGMGSIGDLRNLLEHVQLRGGPPGLQAEIENALAAYIAGTTQRKIQRRIRRAAKRVRRRFRLERLGWLRSPTEHPLV
jgi:hypothetical protein